ncbi:MAG: class I tRNA ligase family protein, partial [Phycisphaerales bacterium]|nr:class I tRNA ligase family protein [Phycisphaerales bacterium]
IDNFRRQLQRFGFCYDWSREFATIDEDYYRWTQWIFVQIYESWYDRDADRARPIAELVEAFASGSRPVTLNPDGAEHTPEEKAEVFDWADLDEVGRHRVVSSWRLAYVGEQTVNWCPMLGTALANEEVIDGRSERGDYPVFRKPLKQWLFRITSYADRLQSDLEPLDWPSSTKTQQREWIGRSEGAEIDFDLVGYDGSLRVYTTRPDTIFGATYMVVAPEHPLVGEVVSSSAEIRAYVEEAKNRSDVERQENKEKTGVPLGIEAVNPATGEHIPVWTADYVLMGYGHGAIMAVPAHDERDFEFAMAFGLPIRDVVYSRIQSAIRYFVEHATDQEARIWPSALADFLGWVTSSNATPETFYDAINTVRTRRPVTADCDVALETVPSDAAGSIGSRRGTVKLVWMDTIESMGFTGFDDLRQCFADKDFIRRSGAASPDAGFSVNSSNDSVSVDGLPKDRAIARIVEWLEAKGIGRKTTNFRLRDWLFSRQRYWGEPFPIVWDERGLHHAAHALPVRLPDMEDYTPEVSDDPKPLLAKAKDWLHTTAGEAGVRDLPEGTPVVRESNTMPGWAGSCWYHLRYTDRHNDDRHASVEAERYWMLSRKGDGPAPEAWDASCHVGGVDLYVGGAEHAVLHLLYARFWHKVLFDLGHTPTPEPFGRLFHQGLITSFAYTDSTGRLIPVDEVEERAEGEFVLQATGERVRRITAKMSKSLKNVINPDDVIADYGADTFRLYEMYMGPLEQTKPWNTDDISGMHRFLQRAWRLCVDEETGEITAIDEPDEAIEKLLHRTIDKASGD